MKILGVADHIDPIVYSSAIRERFGDVDLVIGAGDLPMDYLDFICTTLGKPLVFVFGNHNLTGFHDFNPSADSYEKSSRAGRSGSCTAPAVCILTAR